MEGLEFEEGAAHATEEEVAGVAKRHLFSLSPPVFFFGSVENMMVLSSGESLSSWQAEKGGGRAEDVGLAGGGGEGKKEVIEVCFA